MVMVMAVVGSGSGIDIDIGIGVCSFVSQAHCDHCSLHTYGVIVVREQGMYFPYLDIQRFEMYAVPQKTVSCLVCFIS